jgi:hypothetical protein
MRAGFRKIIWEDLSTTSNAFFRNHEKRRGRTEHLQDVKRRYLKPVLRGPQALRERLTIRNCIGYESALELREATEP